MAVYEISASRALACPDGVLSCSAVPSLEPDPRILVPPNSIATTLKDLGAGQGERQEAELAKKRRKTLDDFQNVL